MKGYGPDPDGSGQCRDIPDILFRKGVISERQKDVWTGMIGFRNTLVHDYADVDRRIVHRILRENLGDLREIAGVFAGYL